MSELKAGSNKRRHDFQISSDLGFTPEQTAALNRRYLQLAEALEAQAGLRGTVQLGADLDLNGFRLKNLGDPQVGTDASNKAHADTASFAAARLFATAGDDLGIDVGDTDEGGDLVDDQPAPVVRSINLAWVNAKKGFRAKWKRPAHSTSKLKGYYISFFHLSLHSPFNLYWMETSDGSVGASESAVERFVTDNRLLMHLNKTKFSHEFITDFPSDTGCAVKITPVTMMHGAEVRGTPAYYPDNTGTKIAIGNDFVTPTDAVNVIDIGVNANAPQQMLVNGDMLFNVGAGVVNAWRRFTVDPATDSSVSDSSANDIYWDKDNHSLIWKGTATRLMQPLKKRLKKSNYYSYMLLAKTDGSFGSGTLVFSIRDSNDTTASDATFSFNLADLTSSFQPFGGTILTNSTSDYTANKFFTARTAATLSGTNNIIIDAIMMVRGKVPYAFTPRSSAYEGDSTDPGTAENITLTTINAVATPDLGNPSGIQGGFDPLGDVINFGTF